ncbi:hypothetical protein M0M57_07800 [Flavobacterium azooxidireducens]|uniref:Uncharacterized protein n=1 Tax=Flavobacterium azooxidireducens TaxID=1871076 RepID=A0ABY4KIW7_9FLAO|nr:hypothetical protein [Flavobacterium azooxidireducens]UPQ80731.1 hypothetical protein M0M57_07800 [Flavobacterium azooxidireducens]
MEKLLPYLFFLLFSTSVLAQKKFVIISNSKIGTVTSEYVQTINLDNNDTTYLVFCSFRNAKYKHISVDKSISFLNDDDLKSFVKDLQNALIEMENKVNMDWTRENYGLSLYDNGNRLFLREKPSKGNGYTTLTKKQVIEFIAWLEAIDFGKG